MIAALAVVTVLVVLLCVLLPDDTAPDNAPPAVVAAAGDASGSAAAPMIVPDAPDEPDALVPPPLQELPDAPASDRPVTEQALVLAQVEQLLRAQQDAPVTLGLRILDTVGQPVPDARVEVWPDLPSLDRRTPGPSEVKWTNGLGHVDLTLPGRSAVLFAVADTVTGTGTATGSATGSATATATATAPHASTGVWSTRDLQRSADANGEVVLTLRPQAALTVHVVQADERPATSAAVVFERMAWRGGSGRLPQQTTTDADGVAQLDVDGHTDVRVSAVLDDQRTHPVRVTTMPGDTTAATLRFPGRWSVAVRLLDAPGEPAPDGQVEAWLDFADHDVAAGDFPDDDGFHAVVVPDAAGRALVELPRPGAYTLLGTRDGDAPSAPVEVLVDDRSPHVDAVLRLAESGVIAGRVVDGDGTPLPGLTVFARPAHLFLEEAERYAPTVWRLHGSAEAETDEAGAFSLGPLHPDGRYVVFCRPVEGRPDLKIVRKDVRTGTHDLLLVASDETLRRATLDGRVVADATGLPVSDFRARLVIQLDGRVLETEDRPALSGDGSFRFEGLAPDYRYRLRVEAPGLGSVELPWFTADRRGRTDNVRLPPVGRAEVLVLDRRHRPVEHAEARALTRSEDFGAQRFSAGRSAVDGRAVFAALPPGRYEVTVELGRASTTGEVVVRSGDTADLVVQLDV